MTPPVQGKAVRDDAGGRADRRQRRRAERLVAPLSDGVRRSRVDLPERAEPVAQLGGVELGLLPGGEVPAALDLVVVDEVGVRLLSPAPRGVDDVVGEDAYGHRNGDVPDGGPAGLVF